MMLLQAVAKCGAIVVLRSHSERPSWPTLAHDIVAYAEANADAMELVGKPEIVSGGEQVKNDPALLTSLQKRLVELGIDRHSYVVGVGGGAFMDMIGFVAATEYDELVRAAMSATRLNQGTDFMGVARGILIQALTILRCAMTIIRSGISNIRYGFWGDIVIWRLIFTPILA